MSFGEKIKAFRLSTKLSQKNFAELIGVPYRTYQTIEQGGTERIEVSALNKLSSMGVDLASLLLYGDANIVPRETQNRLTDPGAETKPGPDHGLTAANIRATEAVRQGGDPAAIVPPELSKGELLIMEFGAWARRTLLDNPSLINQLGPALRHLVDEVEQGRLGALRMEVAADPKRWEEHLHELVGALPDDSRRRFVGRLGLGTVDAGGAERTPDPARKAAAGGGDK